MYIIIIMKFIYRYSSNIYPMFKHKINLDLFISL